MLALPEYSLTRLDTIHCCDALTLLRALPDECVNCIVTSPPYFGLRDYGMPGQIGLEETPQAYVKHLVTVFREARRVLRDDGTLWLNLGDTYAGGGRGGNPENSAFLKQATNKGSHVPAQPVPDGLKPKDLIGIPWRVAFALQEDGWYLRSDIIWYKTNTMPESVTDRPTKAHEYLFLLTKNARYWYDADAIKEPAVCPPGSGQRSFRAIREFRNRRSVWTVPTTPYRESHFATFPPRLIEPCILAGCPKSGVVLDPFMGAGTTALVATRHQRHFMGSELNPDYVQLARRRLMTPIERLNADIRTATYDDLPLFAAAGE